MCIACIPVICYEKLTKAMDSRCTSKQTMAIMGRVKSMNDEVLFCLCSECPSNSCRCADFFFYCCWRLDCAVYSTWMQWFFGWETIAAWPVLHCFGKPRIAASADGPTWRKTMRMDRKASAALAGKICNWWSSWKRRGRGAALGGAFWPTTRFLLAAVPVRALVFWCIVVLSIWAIDSNVDVPWDVYHASCIAHYW